MSAKITNEQLLSYLNQGFLVQYYDIEGVRVGIKTLSQKQIDSVFLSFKADPKGEIRSTYESPSLFAKQFIYSIDSHILNDEEKISVVDELAKGVVEDLYQKWNKMQSNLKDYKDQLPEFVKTPVSKINFKVCKALKTTPDSEIIQNMDPLVKEWFYYAISQDEADLTNEIYEKLEFLVGFFDSDAAKKARNHRLKAQGIMPEGSTITSNFDREILEEIARTDPDFDPEKHTSLDEYLRDKQLNPNEVQTTGDVLNLAEPEITEQEKENFFLHLEREKKSPLTDKEKELAINKLETGQVVNIQEIIAEIEAEELPDAEILDDFDL